MDFRCFRCLSLILVSNPYSSWDSQWLVFTLIQALSSFLAYESWLPSIMTSISTRLISCKKNSSLSCLKHAMWIIPSFRGRHFLLSRPFNTSRFNRSDRVVYQFSHSFQRSSQAQLGSSTGHTGFLFGNSPCLCCWHIVLYHLLHFKALHKKGKIRGEQTVHIFLSYLTVFSLTLPTQHRNLQMTLTLVPLFVSRLASGSVGHIPLLG